MRGCRQRTSPDVPAQVGICGPEHLTNLLVERQDRQLQRAGLSMVGMVGMGGMEGMEGMVGMESGITRGCVQRRHHNHREMHIWSDKKHLYALQCGIHR